MKYVKLIAKPNTWFKEGTEVYSDESDPPDKLVRMTVEEWNNPTFFEDGSGYNYFCGIRVCDTVYENKLYGRGTEKWDFEWWKIDDFEMEIVEEKK
jgi:hypothetical protein